MSAADRREARAQARAVRARAPYPTLRAVGGALTAVLVAGGALSTAPAMMTQEGSRTSALPASMTRLVLVAPRGDVEVRELAAGEDPSVTATARWTLNRPEVRIEEPGGSGTVQVEAPCTGSNLGVCSQDLLVRVPAGTALEIDGTFGDVDVSSTGEVQVEVTGGHIELSGAPTRAAVRSTLGDVTVQHTGEEAPELLRVRTTLGDVDVELPGSQEYAVTTATSQGDRDVRVDEAQDAPSVIDVETTLGDIEIAPAPTL
ncbi:hypothetical protein AVL62_14495 [Serinicoccus chungangensis]|uniref:DUF4097 domain-containing protein n=1 Tax=Serinicoccus chungangensis TaxID=767452 RepID=A0A0W8I432_9MICO|nr:DUF4097 family beta strand repeat-containing protein [Serinicoccus chungangensis]KUG52782.1 hypothetical protein AVL62_14495 [Serinicoccus chungangensis]